MKTTSIKKNWLKSYYFYKNTWKPTTLFFKTTIGIRNLKMKTLNVQTRISHCMMYRFFILKEETSLLIYTTIIDFDESLSELPNVNFAFLVLGGLSFCLNFNEIEKKGNENDVCMLIFFNLQLSTFYCLLKLNLQFQLL